MFIAMNAEKFSPEVLPIIKTKLEELDNDKFILLQSADFRSPIIILLIAVMLGWDRLFLDDIGLGILKILTCYGLGIWWIVDMFTAQQRTREYNFQKFMKLIVL